jgi:RimJ/RimL family protein N-acetyltransferase
VASCGMADADEPGPQGWRLVTDRLVLRRFAAADVEAFHRYRNDAEVARWQGWSVPFARRDSDRFVTEMRRIELFRPGGWTQVAVARRDEPELLIGDFGVRMESEEPTAEIGVTFARAAQGRGYATEGLGVLVDHLLVDRACARVVAVTLAENRPARHLLVRVGFEVVGRDGDELIFSCRR